MIIHYFEWTRLCIMVRESILKYCCILLSVGRFGELVARYVFRVRKTILVEGGRRPPPLFAPVNRCKFTPAYGAAELRRCCVTRRDLSVSENGETEESRGR